MVRKRDKCKNERKIKTLYKNIECMCRIPNAKRLNSRKKMCVRIVYGLYFLCVILYLWILYPPLSHSFSLNFSYSYRFAWNKRRHKQRCKSTSHCRCRFTLTLIQMAILFSIFLFHFRGDKWLFVCLYFSHKMIFRFHFIAKTEKRLVFGECSSPSDVQPKSKHWGAKYRDNFIFIIFDFLTQKEREPFSNPFQFVIYLCFVNENFAESRERRKNKIN